MGPQVQGLYIQIQGLAWKWYGRGSGAVLLNIVLLPYWELTGVGQHPLEIHS